MIEAQGLAVEVGEEIAPARDSNRGLPSSRRPKARAGLRVAIMIQYRYHLVFCFQCIEIMVQYSFTSGGWNGEGGGGSSSFNIYFF